MTEKFLITINGVPDPMLSGDIVEVVVDTDVYLPAMFTILIQDTREPLTGLLKYTDDALRFQIGASVTISVVSESLATNLVPLPNALMIGEVTSVEPVYEKDGSVKLRLRGYDRGHRLTYGKKTRVFGTGNLPTEVNESMIYMKVCAEAGLTCVPDPTLTMIMSGYVMQYNQSDWDFLMSRMLLYGYQMYVMGPSLIVTKAGLERLPPVPFSLEWGKDLVKFEPRIDALGQVSSVEATGWEPKTKMKMTGVGSVALFKPPVIIGQIIPGSAIIATAFGKTTVKDVIMDPRLCDPSQMIRAAQARFDRHASQHIRAKGELSVYNPYVLAGRSVNITGVGGRFTGKYYVTQARHVWRNGVAKVTFEVSGQNPYTFRQILTGDGQGDSSNPQKINGAVVGVVTDNADPMQMGRVKIKFPWLPGPMGMEFESTWARVASPGAGSSRGNLFLPEVNDEVLVIFENGDINRPYVIGGLWNSIDRLPMSGGPAVMPKVGVVKRIIRSRVGHMIVLDDTQGMEQIIIQDKTGQNKIVIKSMDNSITISSTGNMTLEPKGNLTIDAVGQVKITGKAGVQLETTGQMAVKGTTTTVEGTGTMTLKDGAGGQIAFNGPIVNINNGALEVM